MKEVEITCLCSSLTLPDLGLGMVKGQTKHVDADKAALSKDLKRARKARGVSVREVQRVRERLSDQNDFEEKKMFGGISFMIQGNFACGVSSDDLVVRVGPDKYADALADPYTREMDFTGRPMKGWVYVNPDGYESDENLSYWVERGLDFALSLPPK